MTQAKPTASLSSGLLARKGQARPAMRPQGFSGFGTVSDAFDDLGWNDMGAPDDGAVHQPTPAALTPMPTVLRQREALKEEIEAPAEEPTPAPPVAEAPKPAPAKAPVRGVSVATAARIGRETRKKGKRPAKAAFTLRLDQERHLRLRLASALTNRSAQILVTEALDAMLESIPEVEELVRQLPAKG